MAAAAFVYNHAPTPEGAVTAAVKANDLPGLEVALRNGGSTEEKDGVSAKACERWGGWNARISSSTASLPIKFEHDDHHTILDRLRAYLSPFIF